ncbi:hypothetical protein VHN57_17400 [Sphingobium sp. WW5]|uniref:hypothetical protein n=1 Tax=unclassified Sphingobium TaxID=2611147 RepID=UPI003BFBCBEA
MGRSVAPVVSQTSAQTRAIDQGIRNLQHRLAFAQSRLKRLELIGRDVEIECGLLNQNLRRANSSRTCRKMTEIAFACYAIERQALIEIQKLEVECVRLLLRDQPERALGVRSFRPAIAARRKFTNIDLLISTEK